MNASDVIEVAQRFIKEVVTIRSSNPKCPPILRL